MTTYVAGFMFSEDYIRVALIIKNRPRWQEGNANGIGGHIEPGELPMQAMIREFEEETGMKHEDWSAFLTLCSPKGTPKEEEWMVYFFQTTGDIDSLETTTDEHVCLCEVQRLPHNTVPNLKWLVPLAALNEVTGYLVQRR